MTDIVKFIVLFYACKNQKGGKNMVNFDEYVSEMEERRAREKRAKINAMLSQSLREKTHGEVVASLYATLTFLGGVSDILMPVAQQRTAQPAF